MKYIFPKDFKWGSAVWAYYAILDGVNLVGYNTWSFIDL